MQTTLRCRPMAEGTRTRPSKRVRIGLGAGLAVERKHFRAATVAAALTELLNSPDVAGRCRVLAERITKERTINMACDLIEGLAR